MTSRPQRHPSSVLRDLEDHISHGHVEKEYADIAYLLKQDHHLFLLNWLQHQPTKLLPYLQEHVCRESLKNGHTEILEWSRHEYPEVMQKYQKLNGSELVELLTSPKAWKAIKELNLYSPLNSGHAVSIIGLWNTRVCTKNLEARNAIALTLTTIDMLATIGITNPIDVIEWLDVGIRDTRYKNRRLTPITNDSRQQTQIEKVYVRRGMALASLPNPHEWLLAALYKHNHALAYECYRSANPIEPFWQSFIETVDPQKRGNALWHKLTPAHHPSSVPVHWHAILSILPPATSIANGAQLLYDACNIHPDEKKEWQTTPHINIEFDAL